jgi:hypothetical protein
LFWIHLVRHHLKVKGSVDSLFRCANEIIEVYSVSEALPLRHRTLPFTYYSRDVLMSLEARTHWLEPDLQPLPTSQTQEFI